MKKLVMVGMFLITAVAVQAAIIASDDFSGGTAGNELHGNAVQVGSGTWTKTRTDGGIVNPMLYGSGGGATVGSGGNALLANDFSSATEILKVSIEYTANNDKADNQNVIVGFFENVTKGHLINQTSANTGDSFSFRLLTSGTNEGRGAFRISDNGSFVNTTWFGSTTTFDATDVLRLSISYDQQTGDIGADIYNVTDDILMNSGSANVPGLTGFMFAAFATASSADETSPLAFDNFQVESIPEPETLSLMAGAFGGILIIRRRLMI